MLSSAYTTAPRPASSAAPASARLTGLAPSRVRLAMAKTQQPGDRGAPAKPNQTYPASVPTPKTAMASTTPNDGPGADAEDARARRAGCG